MKKIGVLIVMAFFVISAMPVLAAEQAPKERNLIKIIESTLKPGPGKEKNKLRPIKSINIFQNMANGIKEGSAKAKGTSLRTQK
jgi:hypothetical protein